MDKKLLAQVSKKMSWILRHQAEKLQLAIDPEGFVPIGEVLALLRQTMPDISIEIIHAVVATVEPQKQRFSIVEDHIRANYGHSLARPIAYQPMQPPAILYHGTSIVAKPGILEKGLLPMNRQFVHLTTDCALAAQIGARHGKPAILVVNAAMAHDNGVAFYHANRGFWLVNYMPAMYLAAYHG